MSIEKMLGEYKTTVELQSFAEAQFKTIQELTKKVKRLEDENIELKKGFDGGGSLIKKEDADFSKFLTSTDQETISKIQLNRLKEVSFERELTLEESKRVEIFTKILMMMEEKNKTLRVQSKRLDDAELLKLLETSDVEAR